MMSTTGTATMTVEEFRRLPESETHILELQNGEVVRVTRPKKRHDALVYRIRRLLQPVADELGYLKEEFSFRPLPEYELRVADLAWVPWARWRQTEDDDNLHGAPDLVVEVASPSNTAEELQEKKQICLANGCREFWIVYPKLRHVEVWTGREDVRIFRDGDSDGDERIALAAIPGHSVTVADLFAD